MTLTTALVVEDSYSAELLAYLKRDAGEPLRSIAPVGSTAMRQAERVAKVAELNPLVDRALATAQGSGELGPQYMSSRVHVALRGKYLHRLCEPQAQLLVGAGTSRIVRQAQGRLHPLADPTPVECEAMALRGWLQPLRTTGRVEVYGATPVARKELRGNSANRHGLDSFTTLATRRAPSTNGPYLSREQADAGNLLRVRSLSDKPEDKAWVEAALQHLGTGLADAARKVCIEQVKLTDLEDKQGWSIRSGKVVLGIAMTQLSEFIASEGEPNE